MFLSLWLAGQPRQTVIAPAAESVNKKDEAKKMDAAPRLAAPVANTVPNPPEPPRIIASNILAPIKKFGVVSLSLVRHKQNLHVFCRPANRTGCTGFGRARLFWTDYGFVFFWLE